MMQQEDKIITFESYHDPMLAHIIRAKMEANGIPCFIEDDHMAGLNPLYNQSTGIKLKIFERDLEKCRDIIANNNDPDLEEHVEIDPDTEGTMVCPFCASTNVGHLPADENNPGLINTLYSIFDSVVPSYSEKTWHCFNCKQDFE
jgi:hypothetical protein